jgi:hypothetical protein
MAEQFFKKIADDVYLAAEQIQALMTGDLLNDNGDSGDGGGGGGGVNNDGSSSSSGGGGDTGIDDILNDPDFKGLSEDEIRELIADEMMQNNPLQGIADDVTKNIMAGQVSDTHRKRDRRRIESIFGYSIPFKNKMCLSCIIIGIDNLLTHKSFSYLFCFCVIFVVT